MYSVVPAELSNNKKSDKVFYLSKDGKTSFEVFEEQCRDGEALSKMATAIASIDTVGVSNAKKYKRLRALRSGKNNNYYEIKVHGSTARAYSFVFEKREIIVISHIEQVTHSGSGKKDVQRAIEKLKRLDSTVREIIEGKEQ